MKHPIFTLILTAAIPAANVFFGVLALLTGGNPVYVAFSFALATFIALWAHVVAVQAGKGE